MRAAVFTLLAFVVATATLLAQGSDPDRDRDGLSDFQEIHKYCTDPDSADTDGDDVPDGDWNERREYAYTVRTIVQVTRPVHIDAANDDYQDARLLDETDTYVEMEVIHYPLNTVADALAANPKWRSQYPRRTDLAPWLAPGPTANFDPDLRRRILKELKADGIDVLRLDDREAVTQTAKWLLKRAPYVDGFTTFCTAFRDGKPFVPPGLSDAADAGTRNGLTLQEHWERELFAKGMFENRQRGSCTSSAIYLNGCLRAIGIPTRIVLCTPVVDGSDEREVAMVRARLTHHRVRATVLPAIERLGNSWASHTFNEVYVGGRWRRLNYDHLGQNILDTRFFGLMTHVATFRDWADADMPSHWGLRQARRTHRDVMGGSNPYHTLTLSDRFGPHSGIENPLVENPESHAHLTIVSAYWYHSEQRPDVVSMGLDESEAAGHVLVRVQEFHPGLGLEQYRAFWNQVGKRFRLRAEGHDDVPLHATRGYWVAEDEGVRDFYLRIEPAAFRGMALDVAYTLQAEPDDAVFRWIVPDGITLTRTEGVTGPPDDALRSLTIDRVTWSDADEAPASMHDGPLTLLAHVVEWKGFPALKEFTARADARFYLEADGQPTLSIATAVGGITSSDGSTRWIVLPFGPADRRDLRRDVAYTLRPRNGEAHYRWKVKPPLRVVRE